MKSQAACTLAIYDWLLHNSLSLNPDKSEVAIFRTCGRVQSLHDDISVSIAGMQIIESDSIKILGVKLDNHVAFNKHIGNVCKACYFHIRALRHICASMSEETAQMLACAIVSSKLDCCSALLTGMSDANFKLQRV